jgi:hypothetical protein
MTADKGPNSDQALSLPSQHDRCFVGARLTEGRGNHDRMEKRIELRGPQDQIVPLLLQRGKSRRIGDLGTDARLASDRNGLAFQCEDRAPFKMDRNCRGRRVSEWLEVLHLRTPSDPKA